MSPSNFKKQNGFCTKDLASPRQDTRYGYTTVGKY